MIKPSYIYTYIIYNTSICIIYILFIHYKFIHYKYIYNYISIYRHMYHDILLVIIMYEVLFWKLEITIDNNKSDLSLYSKQLFISFTVDIQKDWIVSLLIALFQPRLWLWANKTYTIQEIPVSVLRLDSILFSLFILISSNLRRCIALVGLKVKQLFWQ